MPRAEMIRAREKIMKRIAAGNVVMGIVNVTPDSFSDGGRFASLDAALAQCAALVADGADILDIGGESTRPGFTPVDEAEELRRIEPVLAALGAPGAAALSVDTTKAKVAARAIALGASVINDIWGLQKDPAMADTIAQGGAAAVLMHNRHEKDAAVDIVADMSAFFDISLKLAEKAGVARDLLILDPGIGFGKTQTQNMQAFRAIPLLRAAYGLPVLIGVSRKSFLRNFAPGDAVSLLGATIAANLAAAALGASVFRVHDVREHAAALRTFAHIQRGVLP